METNTNKRQGDQAYEDGIRNRRSDYPAPSSSKQPYTKPAAQRLPIAAPRERLAITGPPKNNKPYWQQKRDGNAPGNQRAYQAEVSSENDEENTMLNDDELEGTIHENEGPETEDESFANFVGISSSCTHCAKSFPSNNKLHKHIHEGCPARNQKITPSASRMSLPTPTRSVPK